MFTITKYFKQQKTILLCVIKCFSVTLKAAFSGLLDLFFLFLKTHNANVNIEIISQCIGSFMSVKQFHDDSKYG